MMAYADIPPSMRPVLSEYDPVGMMISDGPLSLHNMMHGANGGGGRGGGGGGSSLGVIIAAKVEGVKAALVKSLGLLGEMNKSLSELGCPCYMGAFPAG